MRAKEFVINVPINIKINGDGEPEIDMPGSKADNAPDDNEQPAMMTPQEQELELKKAELGKESEFIDQLLDEPDVDDAKDDEEQKSELLPDPEKIRSLI